MTVNAVRLNHAVLFVADLERSVAFYQQAFGMDGRWRVSRAPTPRSCACPGPATTTTSACSASARSRRGREAPRALPPGLAGRHHRGARGGPRSPCATLDAYAGESSHGATKSIYGHDPDGNEFEVMWMLPAGRLGRVRERRADRPSRPAPARFAAGPASAPPPSCVPLGARVTADDAFSTPVVATYGVRPTRPRRSSCCCTAAAPTSATSWAWPRTSRPGRRTPRCGRRSPRAAASPGSPTAASAALSPSRCETTMDWFRAWLDDVAPAGRPVVLVGFSGGAAFAGGLVLDDPSRYAGAAILYGTLPFDAGVPVTPGRLANLPVVRGPGRQRPGHPAELLDRTWTLPASTSREPPNQGLPDGGGHGVSAPMLEALGQWLADRIVYLAQLPVPIAGPRSRRHVAGASRRSAPRTPGPAPEVSWSIPQEQQSDNAPAALQEQLLAQVAALPDVRVGRVPHLGPRCRAPSSPTALRAIPRHSSSRARESLHTCTRRTTDRCTSRCRPTWPPTW